MVYKNVYQFKSTLLETSPVIWRRIQVPESYSFWDLHVAIQDSMGWTDSHLHVFRLKNLNSGKTEEIGIPDNSGFSEDEYPIIAGWEVKIANWFSEKNNTANYEYDFGDGWNHEIVLEQILTKQDKTIYPICLAGERACPPEDCGGVWGYKDMLEIIQDPDHEEHENTMNWLGSKFDPAAFNFKKVKFESPKKRLMNLIAD